VKWIEGRKCLRVFSRVNPALLIHEGLCFFVWGIILPVRNSTPLITLQLFLNINVLCVYKSEIPILLTNVYKILCTFIKCCGIIQFNSIKGYLTP
jgi:hypothetical protein